MFEENRTMLLSLSEKREGVIRNDPDKSEFSNAAHLCERLLRRFCK